MYENTWLVALVFLQLQEQDMFLQTKFQIREKDTHTLVIITHPSLQEVKEKGSSFALWGKYCHYF